MTARQCFKVAYDTPAQARAALKRIHQRKRRDHKPDYERRIYQCPLCGKHHLTKMDKKTDRTIHHRRTDHE